MILVVDDHAQVRTSLLRLLASHGHAATAVAGGRQALEFLLAHTPRLVVLDFHMPDVDGPGVLRVVRGDARLAALPVVMLTASLGTDAPPAEIAALGVQDWIIKASDGWVDPPVAAAAHAAPEP